MLVWLISQGDEGPWSQELWQMLRPLWERASHPSIIEGRRAEAIEAHPGFAPLRAVELWFDDELDREGLLAWFASFSVIGALGRGGAGRDARARGRDRRPPRRVRPPDPAPLARRPARDPARVTGRPAGGQARTSPSARAHSSVRRRVSSTGV